MYHAGTVGQGNVSVAGDEESLLVLPVRAVLGALVQRLIFLVFQFFSLVSLQHFISRFSFLSKLAKDGIQKGTGHVVHIAVRRFYLGVVLLRVHTEADVGRQGPGRGGPCQEVSVLADHLEPDDGRALLHILVALGNLLGRQRRSTAGAVRHDLKSLVEKPLLPDLLQRPPLRLDILIVIGNVRMLHIRPETNGSGEILPHALVFPDTLLTFINKWLQAVLLDLILAVQTQGPLHFQLHRQSVSIPAGLPWHLIALHGAVAGDHILDDTGQHMPDVGLAVGRRRAVVEHIDLIALTLLHTLLKDVVFLPELLRGLLPVHKVQVRRNFLVHG